MNRVRKLNSELEESIRNFKKPPVENTEIVDIPVWMLILVIIGSVVSGYFLFELEILKR